MPEQPTPTPLPEIIDAIRADPAPRVWAELLGVRLDAMRLETEGEIDLAGLLGLRDGVRPGLGAVRHRVVPAGPEPEERYREPAEAVDRHRPVLDIVANPVPVEHVVEVRAASSPGAPR